MGDILHTRTFFFFFITPKPIVESCQSTQAFVPDPILSAMQSDDRGLQGYLAHKKFQPPLGPLYDSRHSPTVGS